MRETKLGEEKRKRDEFAARQRNTRQRPVHDDAAAAASAFIKRLKKTWSQRELAGGRRGGDSLGLMALKNTQEKLVWRQKSRQALLPVIVRGQSSEAVQRVYRSSAVSRDSTLNNACQRSL